MKSRRSINEQGPHNALPLSDASIRLHAYHEKLINLDERILLEQQIDPGSKSEHLAQDTDESPDSSEAVNLEGCLHILRMMERNRQLSLQSDNSILESNHTETHDDNRHLHPKQRAKNEDDSSFCEEQDVHKIGRFEVIRKLGAGGCGIVFLAHDPVLDRAVALKIPMPRFLLNSEFVQRFKREASLAARLSHPNIVSVHEAKSFGPICYIATDYCNAGNLETWLRLFGRPVEPYAAARLVCAIARACQHAHSRGILHRDIKPSNILFDVSDSTLAQLVPASALADAVRLADFGLARPIVDEVHQTSPASVIGTPAYMSPEQASGDNSELGTHSDTFSIGVILYELLTGVSPFARGSALSTLEAVRNDTPASATENPNVSADLAAICAKCLEKRPADRYVTAVALAEDLENFVANRPVNARPISNIGRVWRWARRNQAIATLLSLVAGLIVLLAIGAAMTSFHFVRVNKRIQESLNAETLALQTVVTKEATARRALFDANIANAKAIRSSSQMGRRTDSFHALKQATLLAGDLNILDEAKLVLRSEAIASMSLFDLKPTLRWAAPFDPNGHARANKTGDKFARFGMNADHIEICDSLSNNVLATLELPLDQKTFGAFLFSPDDNFMLERCQIGNDRGKAHLWDLNTQQILRTFDVSVPSHQAVRRNHMPFDFSPDGQFVSVCNGKNLKVFMLDNLHEVASDDFPEILYAVRFCPNSQKLAAGSTSSVWIREFMQPSAADSIQRLTKDENFHIARIAWNYDSTRLAAAIGKEVKIWDINSGVPNRSMIDSSRVISIDFHPDNRLFLTGSSDGFSQIWDLENGQVLLRVPGELTHFSENGDSAFERNAQLELLRPDYVSILKPPGEIAEGSRQMLRVGERSLAIHPNGRLVIVGNGAELTFFDLIAEKCLGVFRNSATRCVFSTDGNSLFLASGQQTMRYDIKVIHQSGASGFEVASTGRLVKPLPAPAVWPKQNHRSGKRFEVVHSEGRSLQFMDRDRKTLHEVPSKSLTGRFADVSIDGNYVVTNGMWAPTRIRNARNGEIVFEAEWNRIFPRFQPNQVHPVLCIANGPFIRVVGKSDDEPWKTEYSSGVSQAPGLPANIAFSEDAKVFAMQNEKCNLQLLDTSDWTPIATLSLPDGQVIHNILFSPNGSRLVASSSTGQLHIWKLDSLQRALAEIGFNWTSAPESNQDQWSRQPIRLIWKQGSN